MKLRYFSIVAVQLFIGQTPTSAQVLRLRIDGTEPEATLGATLVDLGDIDGDGTRALAAGAPLAIGPDGFVNGAVYVFSGANGELMARLDPLSPRGQLGLSLAALRHGDGSSSLVAGAPFTTSEVGYGVGSALAFSAGEGELIWSHIGSEPGTYFGWAVAPAGDLDGDGAPDFFVGTPYASGPGGLGSGTVVAWSLATGKVLFSIGGSQSSDFLGWAVANLGDLNGDGVPDFAAGAPSASPDEIALAGYVDVYSGADQRRLYRIAGRESHAFLGRAIAAVGDLDGDGAADFAVGSPLASPNGVDEAGTVFVFSGATGRPLFRIDGNEAYGNFGSVLAGGIDLDGDGTPDFVIGSPDALRGRGSVFAISGSTGETLFRLDGERDGDSFGRSIALVPNSAGGTEIAVGAPLANPNGVRGAGSLFIFSIGE